APLSYFLEEHTLLLVAIPHYVGGIKRAETSEIVWGGEITVEQARLRTPFPCALASLSYRAGVEVVIEMPASSFFTCVKHGKPAGASDFDPPERAYPR